MPNITSLAVGATSPALTDILQLSGVPVNLTGGSVRFQMRRDIGASNVIDAVATIVSPTAGTVKYDWITSDTATEGIYYAWWKATLSSGLIHQSPEFRFVIDAHAPGVATQLGEISTQTRQLMPVTWDALSSSNIYGDGLLSGRSNYVKYKLFATVVSPLSEATVYNPMVLDYAAKELALQIIPAGIDFWMNAKTSIDSERENVTYPDRIEGLKQLQEWLIIEVSKLRVDLNDNFVVRRKGGFPKVTPTDELLTPNPHDFGSPTDEGIPLNLPWGPFG